MTRASFEELDARLEVITAARPDFRPAAALQRQLLGRMIHGVERLEAHVDAVAARLTPDGTAARLRQGIPAMRGWTPGVPMALLTRDLAPLCDALADGGAGVPAAHVRDAVRSGRVDTGSLLAASFNRNQAAIRTFALHASLAPDLLWLVAELASGPMAFVAQQQIFEDEAARAALEPWSRGYCPACGSWPSFAELTRGARHLRCSYCAADWQPSVCRCVYCAEEGPAFSLAAPDPDRPAWRVELCASCGGYLKSIETAAPILYPLAAVDDMETSPLDLVAMDRGYGRPPLPEFGTALALSDVKCGMTDATRS